MLIAAEVSEYASLYLNDERIIALERFLAGYGQANAGAAPTIAMLRGEKTSNTMLGAEYISGRDPGDITARLLELARGAEDVVSSAGSYARVISFDLVVEAVDSSRPSMYFGDACLGSAVHFLDGVRSGQRAVDAAFAEHHEKVIAAFECWLARECGIAGNPRWWRVARLYGDGAIESLRVIRDQWLEYCKAPSS